MLGIADPGGDATRSHTLIGVTPPRRRSAAAASRQALDRADLASCTFGRLDAEQMPRRRLVPDV